MTSDILLAICMAAAVLFGWIGYYCGKSDAKGGRQKLYNDLVTERSVRHNLNCLVGDLRYERDQQAELKQAARGNIVTLENIVSGLKYDLEESAKCTQLVARARDACLRDNGILHKGVAKLESTLLYRRNLLKEAYDKHKGLEADVRLCKADAAAWNQSKGLWCTDQPRLIKHHQHKELFFRLGYPEHKL